MVIRLLVGCLSRAAGYGSPCWLSSHASMGKAGRPEHTGPPELFYNEDEARKYTSNTRIMEVQANLTERAIELLNLPEGGGPKLLLDLGCGSGLSGEIITEHGHVWVGMDISPAMLDVALEREVEGDLCLGDLGTPLPFRPGTVDGAISISAVQWLCNADSSRANPFKRMKAFFESLYRCLASGARAALQLYPENSAQAEMLTTAAMKAGFSGGLVVDFPHSTRAKKHFLVLMVGGGEMPQATGLDCAEDDGMQVDGHVTVGKPPLFWKRTEGRRREGQGLGSHKERQDETKGIQEHSWGHEIHW